MSAESSRYAWTHKDSRTKPLHDATAQMAVDAQMWQPKRRTRHGCLQATTYTITYKAVDCIIQMFDGKPSGNFYREFMQEQYGFFDFQLLNSLQNGNNLNVQNVKLFS